MIRHLAVIVLAALASVTADADPNTTPRIAIIIDDLGYRATLDQRALALPAEVAVSVLPTAPLTQRIAAAAAAQDRDILVHLPMQSLGGRPAMTDYAPFVLHGETTRAELEQVVAEALAAVPQARGINNHMGSLVTQQPERMRWLMQWLACHRDLYFIDSFTTADSVAHAVAREQHVPTARRDVFLDDHHDVESVRLQFRRLVRLAHERGQALAIGHPRPETFEVLEQELAALDAHGVMLVPATDLLEGSGARDAALLTVAGARSAP